MSAQITVLKNGATVISDDYPHLETVSIGIWLKAGARDETRSQNGIAHVLEHMAFKGTQKRTAAEIAEVIETAGGDLNAATSMEQTAYHARVLKDDWPLALEVLADIVENPVFDETELAREKGVIGQEIAAAGDTPDDLVFDLAQAVAFPGQPLGRPVLGTIENVDSFTSADLTRFQQQHYKTARMVIAAAGRIDHDKLVDEASRYFGSFSAGRNIHRPAARTGAGIDTVAKPLDQTHLTMCFPAMGYLDDDIYPLQVLSIIAGGGMSSRLFQQAREEKGLCYSIFAHVGAYADTSLFSVYAGTGPEKTADLIATAAHGLKSLAAGCRPAELQRAKNQLKAGLVMSLESSPARADQLARQYLAFGGIREMAQIVEKVDAVKNDDIIRLANEIFRPERLVFSAVGVLDGMPEYEDVKAYFA